MAGGREMVGKDIRDGLNAADVWMEAVRGEEDVHVALVTGLPSSASHGAAKQRLKKLLSGGRELMVSTIRKVSLSVLMNYSFAKVGVQQHKPIIG